MVGLNSRRTLLYKATRHGFSGSLFHAYCDGKANTVTIIKTGSNFVFGGYTAAAWKSDGSYSTDATAFIFSLRRNGITFNEKYMVRDATTAICNWAGYGPIFGSYKGSYFCDILIKDFSNIYGGYADFGASYDLPLGYTWESANSRSYLAGSYLNWNTTEIEVFHYNTSTTTTTSTTSSIKARENSNSNRNVTWFGYGCDFYGNDIQIVSIDSSSGCITACIEVLRCTHFTFNGHSRTCYLKNLANVSRRDPDIGWGNSVICGYIYDELFATATATTSTSTTTTTTTSTSTTRTNSNTKTGTISSTTTASMLIFIIDYDE
jgi:hypothetical protein